MKKEINKRIDMARCAKCGEEYTSYRDGYCKGISFKVCQEHYDKRVHRGITSTDEIVPKNECSLCKKE